MAAWNRDIFMSQVKEMLCPAGTAVLSGKP